MNLIYFSLFYFLKFIVIICPDFLLKKIINTIAFVVFKLNKKHRKIIDINLQICFPMQNETQRKDLSLNIYKNYAKFGVDFIKNQNTTKEKVLKKVKFENEEEVQKIFNAKLPLIVTTAHYGNWELLSLYFGARFDGISIVGRALDSKIMDKILSKNRTQFNIELIEKKGGIRKMLKALKEGRSLGILTDQDASDKESLKLKFFDKEVNFLMGASVLAKKLNGVILPCFIYQKDDIYMIKTFKAKYAKENSIEELTKYQAKCCEEMIKFKPDEYFFFHKRFKRYDKNLYTMEK